MIEVEWSRLKAYEVRAQQAQDSPRGAVGTFAFLCNPPLGRRQLSQVDAVRIGVPFLGIEFS